MLLQRRRQELAHRFLELSSWAVGSSAVFGLLHLISLLFSIQVCWQAWLLATCFIMRQVEHGTV